MNDQVKARQEDLPCEDQPKIFNGVDPTPAEKAPPVLVPHAKALSAEQLVELDEINIAKRANDATFQTAIAAHSQKAGDIAVREQEFFTDLAKGMNTTLYEIHGMGMQIRVDRPRGDYGIAIIEVPQQPAAAPRGRILHK